MIFRKLLRMQSRLWRTESKRQERMDETCFKHISEVSHNRKISDQIWKLIQETDMEIHGLR